MTYGNGKGWNATPGLAIGPGFASATHGRTYAMMRLVSTARLHALE